MFTGLIQSKGKILARYHNGSGMVLRVIADGPVHQRLKAARIGDSIAVNGVCLTVTQLPAGPWGFEADLMPETLDMTSLGRLDIASSVNLEAALCLGDSLGGHLVSGDIDGIGQIQALEPRANALVVRIVPQDLELMRWIVLRGRVCVDGVSLTVMERSSEHFALSLIPHSRTLVSFTRPGQICNLETDLLARHFVQAALTQGGIQ